MEIEKEIEWEGQKIKIKVEDDLPVGMVQKVIKHVVKINPVNGMPLPDFYEYVKQICGKMIKDAPFKFDVPDIDKMGKQKYFVLQNLVADLYPIGDFLKGWRELTFGRNLTEQELLSSTE